MKEAITISDEDIEEYRYQYGDLNEQLANIKSQYNDKIKDLKAGKNKEAMELYITERDKKLKDITQNFASDTYIKDKIVKENGQKIDDYFQGIEKDNRGRYNEYRKVFIYNLKALNNDEVHRYRADDLDNKGLFTRSYPSNGQYLGSGGSLPYGDGIYEI